MYAELKEIKCTDTANSQDVAELMLTILHEVKSSYQPSQLWQLGQHCQLSLSQSFCQL